MKIIIAPSKSLIADFFKFLILSFIAYLIFLNLPHLKPSFKPEIVFYIGGGGYIANVFANFFFKK